MWNKCSTKKINMHGVFAILHICFILNLKRQLDLLETIVSNTFIFGILRWFIKIEWKWEDSNLLLHKLESNCLIKLFFSFGTHFAPEFFNTVRKYWIPKNQLCCFRWDCLRFSTNSLTYARDFSPEFQLICTCSNIFSIQIGRWLSNRALE